MSLALYKHQSCNEVQSSRLVDRVFAIHVGSQGFSSPHGMSEQFFRSNRPGYLHPVSTELENSGIRVAVGDCSVTETGQWHPPYQISLLLGSERLIACITCPRQTHTNPS